VIRVSVEVQSGVARFRAVVWGESIDQALGLVRGRYPGCEARVLFPIEPEAFFVAPEFGPGVEEFVPKAPEKQAGESRAVGPGSRLTSTQKWDSTRLRATARRDY